MNLINWHWIET